MAHDTIEPAVHSVIDLFHSKNSLTISGSLYTPIILIKDVKPFKTEWQIQANAIHQWTNILQPLR